MPHLPFLKFYPADWIQDTQVLTLEGQGAWIKVICGLHVSEDYGRREWTRPELMIFLNIQDEEMMSEMLAQLERVADIYARDADDNLSETFETAHYITIICRRMVREKKQRKQWVKDQSVHRQGNVRGMSAGRSQKSEVRSHISDKDSDPSCILPKGRSDKKRKTQFPENFEVKPELLLWALEHQISDPGKELEAFRDYHTSKGNSFIDWNAAFRTWLRNSKKFGTNGKPTVQEQHDDRFRKILRRGL